jgi:hypothetical protein
MRLQLKCNEKVRQAGFQSCNSIARRMGYILKVCAISLIIEVPMLQLKHLILKRKLLEHNLEGLVTFIMFFLAFQIFSLNVKKSLLLIDPKIFKVKLLYLTNEPNKL